MLRLLSILPLLLLFSLRAHADAGKTKNHFPADGFYTGRQKMKYPPSNEGVWYHKNKLFIKNGEAILDMSPINAIKGKTWYSASDGAFYTYRARFFDRDNKTFVQLRLFDNDYAPWLVGHDPYSEVKTYPVKFRQGEFEINGVRYKRTLLKTMERERLEQLLNHEPMEETAEEKAKVEKWMHEWLKNHPAAPPK